MGPRQPPFQRVPENLHRGLSSVQRPPLSTNFHLAARIRISEVLYNFSSLHVAISWCLIRHIGIFTFTRKSKRSSSSCFLKLITEMMCTALSGCEVSGVYCRLLFEQLFRLVWFYSARVECTLISDRSYAWRELPMSINMIHIPGKQGPWANGHAELHNADR
jgi:hypothetical protein